MDQTYHLVWSTPKSLYDEWANDQIRTSLLETLRDVRKSDGKCLNCRERVLKVQRVRVAVDPAKLHHL